MQPPFFIVRMYIKEHETKSWHLIVESLQLHSHGLTAENINGKFLSIARNR